MSPDHTGSVALVLNPRTLHMSPQFHVVFDDDFSTVPYLWKSEMPPNWTDLVKSSHKKVTDDNFELATQWAEELDPVDNMDVDEEYSDEPSVPLPLFNDGEFLATSRDGPKPDSLSDGAPEARGPRTSGMRPKICEFMIDDQSCAVLDLSMSALVDLNDFSCRKHR